MVPWPDKVPSSNIASSAVLDKSVFLMELSYLETLRALALSLCRGESHLKLEDHLVLALAVEQTVWSWVTSHITMTQAVRDPNWHATETSNSHTCDLFMATSLCYDWTATAASTGWERKYPIKIVNCVIWDQFLAKRAITFDKEWGPCQVMQSLPSLHCMRSTLSNWVSSRDSTTPKQNLPRQARTNNPTN